MRTKRTVLTSLVLTALALTLGLAPAHSGPAKSDTRGTLGAADQRMLRAEAAAAPATSLLTAASKVALATIQSRIAQWVQANGPRHSFGSFVDPQTGRIVLETDAPAGVVATLVGALGGLVDLRTGSISDAFSRKSDVPAFWGGAGITQSVGVAWCSAGFTVQRGGARFLVTAGHCFANGTTVVTENGGVTMGTVSDRGPLPPFDMELIGGGSYSASIYVGGVDSSAGNPVVAAADPWVGVTGYCHSGRTTGEQCGHTVNSVDAQVCTATGCKSPVIAYTGGNLHQGGDSGSPFYIKSGTNVHIRGIIIASGGGTGYAEKWSRISSHLGVSIVT